MHLHHKKKNHKNECDFSAVVAGVADKVDGEYADASNFMLIHNQKKIINWNENKWNKHIYTTMLLRSLCSKFYKQISISDFIEFKLWLF